MKRRYTTKSLFAIIAIVSVVLWAAYVKTEHTITLPNASALNFKTGDPVSIIHKTKGTKQPVFYVRNENVVDLVAHPAGCGITFRASAFTKLNLWLQGYDNLIALPGIHK